MKAGGAALLDLITGDSSLAINRAAMTDGTGKFGMLLLEHGKGRSAPGFQALFPTLQGSPILGPGEPFEIFSVFQGLLLSDRQVRVLLGDRTTTPKARQFRQLAEMAFTRLQTLYPA